MSTDWLNIFRASIVVAKERVLIAAVLASLLLAAAPRETPVAVIAHRGLARGMPENTLAALRNSIDRGVEIVEIDLRLTRDGQLVVIHDALLNRTTNCAGPVQSRTFAQVRRCDAGWPTHPGERVPSFAEALALAKAGSVRVLADVKDDDALDPVLAVIREQRAEDLVILGLRRTVHVARARRTVPGVTILANMRSPMDAAAFAKAGAQIIRIWSDWVETDPELVRRTRARGQEVWIMVGRRQPAGARRWRQLHGRMIAAGAQGLITDRPELISAQ